MDQQDRTQLGDPRHTLAQRRRVACRELVDPAWAHERLEAHDPAPEQGLQAVEVAWHQPAPQSEVNLRRPLHRLELQVERGDVRSHGEIV